MFWDASSSTAAVMDLKTYSAILLTGEDCFFIYLTYSKGNRLKVMSIDN